MEQNTVSGNAAQLLKPLENNAIGQITEENIRFWNAVDREDAAARKAAKARQAELEFKQQEENNKRLDKYFESKPTSDSDGYLNFQISGLKDSFDEIYTQNAIAAVTGTPEERIAANLNNDKFYNKLTLWSKFNNATQETGKRLSEQTYNDAVDFEKKRFVDTVLGIGYTIDKETAEMVTVNPDGTETRRSIEDVDSYVRNMNYTPIAEFTEMGLKELGTIALPDTNGNIYATKANKEAALVRAKAWVADESLARQLADKLGFKDYDEKRSVFETFTKEDFTDLATKASELYIESGFKQVNNSLDNTLKNLNIKNARNDIKNNTVQRPSISNNRTDGSWSDVLKIGDKEIKLKNDAVVYSMDISQGKQVTFFSDDNKTSPVLLSNFSIDKDGKITAYGVQQVKTQVQETDANNKPLFKQELQRVLKNGKPVMEVVNRVSKEKTKVVSVPVMKEVIVNKPIITSNENTITKIMEVIPNPNGSENNLTALENAKLWQQERNKARESAPTNKTPKFN